MEMHEQRCCFGSASWTPGCRGRGAGAPGGPFPELAAGACGQPQPHPVGSAVLPGGLLLVLCAPSPAASVCPEESGVLSAPVRGPQGPSHRITSVLPPQDPYFMKNHLGSYECKLCLTLHNNEVWPRPCPTPHPAPPVLLWTWRVLQYRWHRCHRCVSGNMGTPWDVPRQGRGREV